MTQARVSRRDFLKLASLGLGSVAFTPLERTLPLLSLQPGGALGRIFRRTDVRARPDFSSGIVDTLYDDTIVSWVKEAAASYLDLNSVNQRWVEIAYEDGRKGGYVFSHDIQPVGNLPNTALDALPAGKQGFWAEVTVPYVDFVLDNPPPRSFFLKYLVENNLPTRLYYSQVMWVDSVRQAENGTVLYRINERYGNPGDIFWAPGSAFRPITEADVTPISPDVDPDEKRIVANITYQTLSCFEGKREVYFCRMSSGILEKSTPVGTLHTWRKLISVRMAGGTGASGYDTPGVPWTTMIQGEGVAIHATFWHNNYGQVRSHGCLNVAPEDARWIFRWTSPSVQLDVGDITVQWPNHGTVVDVVERLY